MIFKKGKAAPGKSEQAGEGTAPTQNAQVSQYNQDNEAKVQSNVQSPLSILGMRKETWTDYESLDMEIQKGQAFALLGLLGVPVALLILIGGSFLIGSKQIAMAIGIPALFVGGIFAIGANILRLQTKRLKRIRDNWDNKQTGTTA